MIFERMRQMQYLGKILPVDGYEVRLASSLPTDYLHSLHHLYQPLIGIEAISLYQTLLLQLEVQAEVSIQTHHTLMNYLNLPLDKIYEARLKLEGIGLLKTYRFESDDRVYFTYELQAPFSPRQFFADMMLSELLYRQLGKSRFSLLKHYYTKTEERDIGKDITASFGDVFETFQSQAPIHTPARPEKSPSIPIKAVDFSILEQTLKRKMIPVNKVLTETNKKAIVQLMQLYELETYEVENALLWALTDENTLDIEQLRAACHDLFRAKHNVTDVKLSVKKESERTEQKQLSKEERLIATFESITPKQLLEDLSAGHNASEQDMKLISEIMLKQGLPNPVMNVLIHYVLLQSNMKLSKPYLEKIASHWSRAKLKTAKEAMEFARKQAEPQVKQQRNYRKKNGTKEVIPEWFKERKVKQQSSKQESAFQNEEKEDEELVKLLQRHASEK